MKTVTFYSYKGGVGRSLALAYTARFLAESNFSVCIVDADLEAPGVIYKLIDRPDHSKPGLLDYVLKYTGEGPPENLREYFYDIPESRSKFGYVKIMSAGKGLAGDYWRELSKINWRGLFKGGNNEGLMMFEYLKFQIQTEFNPDFLFIDARSGVTVLSKVCSAVLADAAIVLMANNQENFHGTRLMYKYIEDSRFKPNGKKNDVFCVLTRIPPESTPTKAERVAKLIKAIDAPQLKAENIAIIHSYPDVESDEYIVFKRKDDVKDESSIQGDYYKLITKIVDPQMLEIKRTVVSNFNDFYFDESIVKNIFTSEFNRLNNNLTLQDFCNKMLRNVNEELPSQQDLYSLAVCMWHFNKSMDAITYLCKAIAVGKTHSTVYKNARYLRGLIYLYVFHNFSKAELDLKAVLCSGEGIYASQQIHLSECLAGLGKFDEALNHINIYLENNENDYMALTTRADIILEKLKATESVIIGKFLNPEIIKALGDLENAILLNEGYMLAFIRRGDVYLNLGDYKSALENYNSAIAIDPSFHAAYNNRGATYSFMDEHEKALLDYNKAIEINPYYALPYSNRGNALAMLGAMEKALLDYNEAIRIDPGYASVYKRRGKLYKYIIMNDEKAEADFAKYRELSTQT